MITSIQAHLVEVLSKSEDNASTYGIAIAVRVGREYLSTDFLVVIQDSGLTCYVPQAQCLFLSPARPEDYTGE